MNSIIITINKHILTPLSLKDKIKLQRSMHQAVPVNYNGRVEFDSSLPLSQYRDDIANIFRMDATILRAELERRYLEVALTEANPKKHSGHKIRVATNWNPLWYRLLYEDRRISRRLLKHSLERIIDGKDMKTHKRAHTGSSVYDGELRGTIYSRLLNGVEDMFGQQRFYHPPDPEIVELFEDYFVIN